MQLLRASLISVLLSITVLCTSVGQTAPEKVETENLPTMAVFPPVTHGVLVFLKAAAQVDGAQIRAQVLPRVQKEVEDKKWPFRILPLETVVTVYEAATGETFPSNKMPRFKALKPLAEKLGCRYLILVSVNERIAFRKSSILSEPVGGHAYQTSAELIFFVYDHEANDYVWTATQSTPTHDPSNADPDGDMTPELRGAFYTAYMKGLEPFSKGKRVHVERPVLSLSEQEK